MSRTASHPEALVSHRSARTTFHGRLLIVRRHQAGWPPAHIAKAMGVSCKCVKTWIDRFAIEGEGGLVDRSSRPRVSPTRTSPALEARIVELRNGSRRGPDWIAAELGVAVRTVSRVIARHGLPRLAQLDPITKRWSRRASRLRCAMSVSGPASWCTWTSKRSAASPTAAAGAPTAAPPARPPATGQRRSGRCRRRPAPDRTVRASGCGHAGAVRFSTLAPCAGHSQ